MKIGAFVGSFNPPHEGHRKVAKYLVDNKIVDLVLFLPTPDYWDKTDLAAFEDRVNMLKVFEEDNIKIDSINNQFPYTYQVLRSLKNNYPNDEIYLVIGDDQLEKLHLWKNIDEILENKIIVLKRNNIIPNINLEKYKYQFIYIDDFDPINISSTEIRNGDYKEIDPKIVEYIKNHSLYKEE